MTAALGGCEWSAAHPGRTLPPGKTRYSLYRRLGGPQGRSGQVENLVPTGIRSRTVQPVAQSLYRLSYPIPPIVLLDIPLQASSHYIYANVGSDVFQQWQALWSGWQNGRGWRGIYEQADNAKPLGGRYPHQVWDTLPWPNHISLAPFSCELSPNKLSFSCRLLFCDVSSLHWEIELAKGRCWGLSEVRCLLQKKAPDVRSK